MKIRQLTLSEFRGFSEPNTFSFSPQFAAVAGINGRGKTAILDSLAILLGRIVRALELASPSVRGMSPTDIFSGARSASLKMQANFAGIPLEFGIEFDGRSPRVTTGPTPALRSEILSRYADRNRPDDRAPIAVYYTTDRAGYRLPRNLPATLPVNRQLAYQGALVNRMVNYAELMARYRLWVRTDDYRARGAFDRALGTFLEGFSDARVEEDPLRITVAKANQRLSLKQLSDGERSFIAIVGDLVRRLSLANPEIDDPLLGVGVVLIDELELHLHPRWQREVVEKLRTTFPNIQFIATTHSPFVIQSLRPGELINLDPEEFGDYANRSVEDIAENVMGVDLPQKSSRYLDMMGAAAQYYELLKAPTATANEVRAAEERLAALSMPYSDDPAFQALLKLERLTRPGGDDAAG